MAEAKSEIEDQYLKVFREILSHDVKQGAVNNGSSPNLGKLVDYDLYRNPSNAKKIFLDYSVGEDDRPKVEINLYRKYNYNSKDNIAPMASLEQAQEKAENWRKILSENGLNADVDAIEKGKSTYFGYYYAIEIKFDSLTKGKEAKQHRDNLAKLGKISEKIADVVNLTEFQDSDFEKFASEMRSQCNEIKNILANGKTEGIAGILEAMTKLNAAYRKPHAARAERLVKKYSVDEPAQGRG